GVVVDEEDAGAVHAHQRATTFEVPTSVTSGVVPAQYTQLMSPETLRVVSVSVKTVTPVPRTRSSVTSSATTAPVSIWTVSRSHGPSTRTYAPSVSRTRVPSHATVVVTLLRMSSRSAVRSGSVTAGASPRPVGSSEVAGAGV